MNSNNNILYKYIRMLEYYYNNYNIYTVLYMVFIEFIICVCIVRILYIFKHIGYHNKYIPINNYYMYTDPSNIGVSRELYIFNTREPGSTTIMQRILRNYNNSNTNTTIVDIGANIGYYVCMEAIYNNNRVYAIEPVPDNITILKDNIRLNNYKNIVVFPYAIGSSNGYTTMVIPDKKNLSFIPHSNPQGVHHVDLGKLPRIRVPIMTLDTFCKEQGVVPDIVRMDVEGHELHIVRGMKDTLKVMPMGSWIFIEMHLIPLGNNVHEIYDTLKRYGFKEVYCLREGKNPPRFNYGHIRSLFPGLKLPVIEHTMSFFRKEAIE